jgi:trans-aconitate methyltransferase
MNRNDLVKEYDAYFTAEPGKWVSDRRNEYAVKAIECFNKNPVSILDVGCGNGHTLLAMQKRFPDAVLHGMDISPVACEIASKNVSGAGILNIFVEDCEITFTNDVVLCMGTAEHFVDPNAGLLALRRFTTGILYLEIPNNLKYSPGDEGYRRLSCGSRQMEWHLKRDTWEKMIKQAGFEIVASYTGHKPSWEFIWILR